MIPKVIKLNNQVFGLDLQYQQFDQINNIQMQKSAIAMNELMRSEAFKNMTKGMGSVFGQSEEVMDRINSASDYTNNEDALRAMGNMKKSLADAIKGLPEAMVSNMEKSIEELETSFGDEDSSEEDVQELQLRVSVGWFKRASKIQIETALKLQSHQGDVIAAIGKSVFTYINANLRAINKSIAQSGITAPRMKKLEKDSEAVGLFTLDEIFLDSLTPECRILGTISIEGAFDQNGFDALVSLKDKKPAVDFKMIEPESEDEDES